MPGRLFGRVDTRGEGENDSRLLGIDLGAVGVKIVACHGGGTRLGQVHANSRGHPLAALLEAITKLPEDLRAGPVRIAITGSGQYLPENIAQCEACERGSGHCAGRCEQPFPAHAP